MTPEAVFQAANMLTLAAWVLLATRPRAAMVQRLAGTVVPVMLAGTYSVLAALFIGRGTGDFNSLAGVSAPSAAPAADTDAPDASDSDGSEPPSANESTEVH